MKTIPTVAANAYIARAIKNARTITTVDSAAVSRAAGALEGTAALCDDMEGDTTIPLSLTVDELRNFVHYMRTLDRMARETAPAVEELRATRKECDQYLARIKLLEKTLELKGSEAAEAAGAESEPVAARIRNRARKGARRKAAPARDKPEGGGDPVRPEK